MTEVQVYGAASGNNLGIPGLGSFDTSSVTIPRITIDHEQGKFKDNLSGLLHDELNVVILGLVRQRILWPKKMGDSDKPQCKSRNADVGYPVLEGDPKVVYPFRSSNLDVTDLFDDGHGNKALACASCNLKEWTGPKGEKEPPRCSEQFTFVMQDEEVGANMLYTVQRTAITPAKKYITSFIQRGQAMFTRETKLTVKVVGGSQRSYGVPVFTGGDPTDSTRWADWGEEYDSIAAFITRPPQGDGNEEDGEANVQAANTASTTANVNPAAANVVIPGEVAQATQVVRPVTRPAAVIDVAPLPDDEDDLPF